MKYSLLDLTQTVLSSMDSDAVNSITDTAESTQVSTLIRTVFFDLVARGDLPENYTWFTLTASGSALKPTLMTLPDDVISIMWVKYNKSTASDTDIEYEDLLSMRREAFLERMYMLRQSDTNVGLFSHSVEGYSANFLYLNDRAPSSYTLFNDRTLIFDSYDAAVDTTLQSNKTLAYGKKSYTWTETDLFEPPLNDEQFALLLNESKALAWAELKQAPHSKAEQNARRGWSHSQKTKNAIKLESDLNQLPNFGRK